MTARWGPGEVIVRREVLGLAPGFQPEPPPPWHGRPWEALPVYVVEDTAEQLVTFIAEGAEIGFVDGPWPTPDGQHPWSHKDAWEGHGCLMVQRPGDPYAVWHFWLGPERDTAGMVDWIRELGAGLVRRLEAGERFWDERWISWAPPDGWTPPRLPAGWRDVP